MNRSLVVLNTWATSSPSSAGSISSSSWSSWRRPRAEPVDVGGGQAAGGDQVEQLLHADVLAGGDADDRNELARRRSRRGRPCELVGADDSPSR